MIEKKEHIPDNVSETTPNDSYNTTYALGAVCLWVVFGVFSFSCDITHLMSNNLLFRHLAGIVSFFFLFSIIKKNDMNVLNSWGRAGLIYFAYLMLTKCQWWITIPVIIILLIDQSLKIQQKYDTINKVQSIFSQNPDMIESIRTASTYAIYGLISLGFIIYIIDQSDQMPLKDILFGYVKC